MKTKIFIIEIGIFDNFYNSKYKDTNTKIVNKLKKEFQNLEK